MPLTEFLLAPLGGLRLFI